MIEFLHQPLLLDVSLLDFIGITFIMMLGAALQASAGFGSGLVAVPLIVLIDTRLVPGPILFAYIFLSVFIVLKERKHVSQTTQHALISGLAFGSALSLFALFFIANEHFPIIAAMMVLLGVFLSLFRKGLTLNGKTLFISGSLSGIMSTLAGLSGPPMALALQFEKPEFIRANLAFAFIFASLFSIAVLLLKGRFHLEYLALGSLMVPGMFLGFLLGKSLSAYLNAQLSRWMILGISTASALSLLYKSLG